MFLPEVTNRRLPTTFAPVVRPTSCLIEPRYSTLLDITASGSGGTGDWARAGAGRARHATASAAARRVLGMASETQLYGEPCAPGRVGLAARRREREERYATHRSCCRTARRSRRRARRGRRRTRRATGGQDAGRRLDCHQPVREGRRALLAGTSHRRLGLAGDLQAHDEGGRAAHG